MQLFLLSLCYRMYDTFPDLFGILSRFTDSPTEIVSTFIFVKAIECLVLLSNSQVIAMI